MDPDSILIEPEELDECHAVAESMLGAPIDECDPDVIAYVIRRLADANDYMVGHLTSSDPDAAITLQESLRMGMVESEAVN